MNGDMLHSLVAEAMLAPSVHNVQPARWRLEGETIELLEDVRTRLSIGDPRGNDAMISLGAAAEGLKLAASRRGIALEPCETLPQTDAMLVPVARYRLLPTDRAADPLAEQVKKRASWRGDFTPATRADREVARQLADTDAAVLVDPAALVEAARIFDTASYGFLRKPEFRNELRAWMRLTQRHPRWDRDGLNADAMALGRIQAMGASLVLGPAFGVLDRIGVAPKLLAEGTKVAAAAGLIVFHRPGTESPFDSGTRFYRLWLQIEGLGFGAAVLAALADDAVAARHTAEMVGVPSGRRIVSAFRIGRRPEGVVVKRARRELAEILV